VCEEAVTQLKGAVVSLKNIAILTAFGVVTAVGGMLYEKLNVGMQKVVIQKAVCV
jgi:hypothetical protein